MTQPVIVTAIFHIRPDSRDAVVAALHTALPLVHDEPGCELYAIHEAADGTLVMIEKWESEALLDDHGSSPAVAALVGEIGQYLTAEVAVTRMTAIPIGTSGKGAL
ncbi:antibiotic biosynthesis monooxygenase [Salinibacterium sp. UTAS2018]|uniref:putative quinol monooxygenase n=1 Tax=Salinibacterium sp. UTAS2018 TaxID=2508880 RepID=UPI00100942E9|nr:putative quinol monooxygenase [Salinibacterium sp. UTAS2018]QAV71287.1 antibiotic biosynthesis monooxygenase [Salinibacterium sp. UTAS2018]